MNKLLFKSLLAIDSVCASRQRVRSSSRADRSAGGKFQRSGNREPVAAAPVADTEVPKVEPTAVPEPTEISVTDIELWAGGRVTEAGPPPDDWVAYDIIKDKAKVNLKLVLLPSTQSDQDAKINAAGASNSLPDVFMVSRDVLYKLVQAGLIAKVDDLLPQMPVRTEGHYSDVDRNKLATWDGVHVRLARSRCAAPDRFSGRSPGLARQTRPSVAQDTRRIHDCRQSVHLR